MSEGGTRTVCAHRLAAEAEVSLPTLRRRLKILKVRGLLRIRHNRPYGVWRPSTYQVVLPRAVNAGGRELLLSGAR